MSLASPGDRIIGIDEVGRGAWAGPLVVGAVECVVGVDFPGVRDSKLMRPTARQTANRLVRARSLRTGLGWVSPGEIDQLGLTPALRLAADRALSNLGAETGLIIVDGNDAYVPAGFNGHAIIGADRLVPVVAAASVIAKVARDSYMASLDRITPHYNFAAHKGYGTQLHRAALDAHGPSLHHRLSWAPLVAYGERS